MAIADDFSIAANGDIREVGGSTNYPVLDLHRWLNDKADDASVIGDDLVDILSDDPSERNTDQVVKLINGFNIDDTVSRRFFGGSIEQGTGGTQVRYSGLQIIGTFLTGVPQVVQNNAILTNFWGVSFNPDPTVGAAVRILVKTIDAGVLIDGGRVRVQVRGYSEQYREASTVLSEGEKPAAPGNIQLDPFNQTAEGTIATYTDIVNVEGFQQIDLNNTNGPRDYYSQWDKASRTRSDLYERIKWLTREGTSETLYGLNGELFRGITHQIAYDTESGGPFTEPEGLTWTGGTGQLLALDDQGTTGTIWIQLLTGTAPSSGTTLTGTTSAATCNVSATPTNRPLGVESVIGNYTGSLLGAYGVGVEADDLNKTDSLVDLTNTTQTPPDNVSIVFNGLAASEDYVVLGRDDGGGKIDKATYTLAANNDLGESTIDVNEAILSTERASGEIRIWNGSSYDLYSYTSYSGSTFSGVTPTLSQNYTLNDPAFVPFIDELSGGSSINKTIVYDGTPINVVGRVRDGGASPIKPVPVVGTIGSNGFTVTINRVSDT